ncbi:MAG: uracil-DNA glycosylase family protein [Candidatus Omnitrophota bacterium]
MDEFLINNKKKFRKLVVHIKNLRKCRKCKKMHLPVVSGGAVVSNVLLVGQAPGDKEPKLGRPFAWTAGKTLFGWFEEAAGITEEKFRASIYMAAVCRCFPGKNPQGGDRVPTPQEILNCSAWLNRELIILKPRLVIPVGKLAIAQFISLEKLDQIIGKKFIVTKNGCSFDLIPLPHPSGASPWHRKEPGKSLLKKAMKLIARHSALNLK